MKSVLVPLLLAVAGCSDVLGIEEKELVHSPPPPGPRPPERPTVSESGAAFTKTFAARQYYFGAIDPETNQRNPNAWREIGFDIDGVNTTELLAASSDPGTCRAVPSSVLVPLADGHEGRDNAFAGHAMEEISKHADAPDTVELSITESVAKGMPTFIASLSDLNEGPDDPHVVLGLMVSRRNDAGGPVWNGNDRFPIDERTVQKNTLIPHMRFQNAYMTNNVVVSGDFNAASESVFLLPFDPKQGIVEAKPLAFTLTLELDDGHEHVLRSTLSMVMTVSDVFDVLKPFAQQAGLGCDPLGLLTLIEWHADLSIGQPSFLDASSKTRCDALSVAFAVDWELVKNPGVEDVDAADPNEAPCD